MRVFKQTYKDKTTGEKKKTSKWYIEFRDHNQIVRRWPTFTDKARAAELGRKIGMLVSCRISGDRPDQALAAWLETLTTKLQTKLADIGLLEGRYLAAAQPLSEHLADFRQSLKAKNNSERHVELVTRRAEKVIEGCGFVGWSSISANDVMNYLDGLRQDKKGKGDKVKLGISAQTSNFYLQSIKQFCRWMVKERRATESPLAHLDGLNVRTDRRHDRRALTVDEVKRLLSAAENGEDYQSITGPERAMLYRLAVETGLRRGELASLTRASFDLDSEQPTVTVAAAYSKRRRTDVVPLRPETALTLRTFLAGKMAGVRAFSMPPRRQNVTMLKIDLKAAGISYRDDTDRVADFHALRHTCGSWLAAAGVHPKVMQGILRHSTITMTMDRYTHPFKNDQAEGIAKLPDLSGHGRDVAKATGTDTAEPGSSDWASCWASRVRKHAICGDTMRQEPSPKCESKLEEKPYISREKPEKQELKAVGVGFEPTVRETRTPVFKTGPFDHSGTPPGVTSPWRAALYRV